MSRPSWVTPLGEVSEVVCGGRDAWPIFARTLKKQAERGIMSSRKVNVGQGTLTSRRSAITSDTLRDKAGKIFSDLQRDAWRESWAEAEDLTPEHDNKLVNGGPTGLFLTACLCYFRRTAYLVAEGQTRKAIRIAPDGTHDSVPPATRNSKGILVRNEASVPFVTTPSLEGARNSHEEVNAEMAFTDMLQMGAMAASGLGATGLVAVMTPAIMGVKGNMSRHDWDLSDVQRAVRICLRSWYGYCDMGKAVAHMSGETRSLKRLSLDSLAPAPVGWNSGYRAYFDGTDSAGFVDDTGRSKNSSVTLRSDMTMARGAAGGRAHENITKGHIRIAGAGADSHAVSEHVIMKNDSAQTFGTQPFTR